MATSNGPDLTFAQQQVEALMDDTCSAADVSDPSAWVIDPVTLRLTPPAGTAILTDGKCKIKALGALAGGVTARAGQQIAVDQYKLDMPLSAPELAEGQTVTLTSSRRQPQMVGDVFIVSGPQWKTTAVQASYVLQRQRRVE